MKCNMYDVHLNRNKLIMLENLLYWIFLQIIKNVAYFE